MICRQQIRKRALQSLGTEAGLKQDYFTYRNMGFKMTQKKSYKQFKELKEAPQELEDGRN